jgi:NAD(P)-dependent dehydrogenase (short-subunit alcohol dehydrogenase family)
LSFEGKTILITGASGGIGSETALHFAREKANVVVNYLSSSEKAERTVQLIRELGAEALPFKADVSKLEEVKAMMVAAEERFGGLDVLVNNAAKHPPPMFDLKKPDWELWKSMAHINVMGVLVCSHFAADYLRKTQGNIVNVVMDWDAGGIGYALTKTAGTPLTRGLARELAPIRVNAVSPGAVDTWGMTDEEKEYWIERTLLKRVGQPKDIAKAIAFLASDEASYITGATIQVDGGTRLLV